MSSPKHSWLDRWWPLLLILFGLVFTLCLTLYRPQHEWSALRNPSPVQAAALELPPGPLAPHQS